MKIQVLLTLIAGLLVAAVAPKDEQAKNEAEKLFRNMEEKLTKATTL